MMAEVKAVAAAHGIRFRLSIDKRIAGAEAIGAHTTSMLQDIEAGRAPEIEFIDMPEVLRGKYQYYTRADVAKLRATGYARAMTPLTEAVRDYVQGYLVPGKKLGE